jgi:hypothetical protein
MLWCEDVYCRGVEKGGVSFVQEPDESVVYASSKCELSKTMHYMYEVLIYF